MINIQKFLTEIGTEIEQFTITTLTETLTIGNHYGTFIVEQINGKDTSMIPTTKHTFLNKDYSLNTDNLTDIIRIDVPLTINDEDEGIIEQEHSGTWMNYL